MEEVMGPGSRPKQHRRRADRTENEKGQKGDLIAACRLRQLRDRPHSTRCVHSLTQVRPLLQIQGLDISAALDRKSRETPAMPRRALPVMQRSPARTEISYRRLRFTSEHVSHPAHRADKRVAAFQLSPQMADVDIESAVVGSCLPFEQRFGDL